MPQGTELTVYINGDFPVDPGKFGGASAAPAHPAEPSPAGTAPTIVLVDPSLTSSGETIDVTNPSLNIRGVVTDQTGLPAVTINGSPVGMLPKGPQAAEFSSNGIKLHSGDNSFEIIATNAAHIQARITFVARYSAATAAPTPAAPRAKPKGLEKAEILSLLQGGVPSARVAQLVGEKGIAFAPTDDAMKEIRAAGGGQDLADALAKAKHSR